jgi:hypothetical protein
MACLGSAPKPGLIGRWRLPFPHMGYIFGRRSQNVF